MHFSTFQNIGTNLRVSLRRQKNAGERSKNVSSKVAAHALFSFPHLLHYSFQLRLNTFEDDELCIAGEICDGVA